MPERKKISDTCLLNRLVDGEMKAYEEIFVRYYPTLCAYARMYVKREETAENIVQDLMLWLWENRTVLCISTSLPKYLFGAVRNNCLTYLGHESIERRVLGNIRKQGLEKLSRMPLGDVQARSFICSVLTGAWRWPRWPRCRWACSFSC